MEELEATVTIDIQINTTKEGNMLACHIPEFDLYFDANNQEDAIRIGTVMVRAWIDHHRQEYLCQS